MTTLYILLGIIGFFSPVWTAYLYEYFYQEDYFYFVNALPWNCYSLYSSADAIVPIANYYYNGRDVRIAVKASDMFKLGQSEDCTSYKVQRFWMAYGLSVVEFTASSNLLGNDESDSSGALYTDEELAPPMRHLQINTYVPIKRLMLTAIEKADVHTQNTASFQQR